MECGAAALHTPRDGSDVEQRQCPGAWNQAIPRTGGCVPGVAYRGLAGVLVVLYGAQVIPHTEAGDQEAMVSSEEALPE